MGQRYYQSAIVRFSPGHVLGFVSKPLSSGAMYSRGGRALLVWGMLLTMSYQVTLRKHSCGG